MLNYIKLLIITFILNYSMSKIYKFNKKNDAI